MSKTVHMSWLPSPSSNRCNPVGSRSIVTVLWRWRMPQSDDGRHLGFRRENPAALGARIQKQTGV
jgi:hypothetical protein